MNTFNFEYSNVGENEQYVCISLSGKLNEENCNYLMECVESQIESGETKLILDCERLIYISSMGLGILVRAHSRMRKLGGEVVLANLHGPTAEIVRLVGLNRVFHIHPSLDAAISSLDKLE